MGLLSRKLSRHGARVIHLDRPFNKRSFLARLHNTPIDAAKNPVQKLKQLLNVFGRVISVIIGYARVSTEDQHLDAQTTALEAIGADRIFAEKISGTKKSRPELDRMIEQLRDGGAA